MATSNFSKAALNNARSHKPWERAENDARDNIETSQFDFDDAAALTASAVGSQVSAAAPDVQHTSVAHEITHVALRHSPPMPDMKGVSALAGNTDAPAGSEKPVELQSAPATVQPSFGAPTAQAIDLTPAPAPQAGGIGGPTEFDRRGQPGRSVRSPLPRQRRLGGRRDIARRLPAELRANSGALPRY